MKRVTILAALLMAASGVSSVNAATIINDNFESYTSQANFEATWTPSGLSGAWTTDQSTSPTHSIGNTAANTELNILTFSATPATDIVATDTDPLVWSYQFYDAPANIVGIGNTLGRDYGQLQGRRASDGMLTQVLSMGLWNANVPKASDGVVSDTATLRKYYAARTAFSPGDNWILLDTGPLRSAGWHELKAVIGSTQINYYVDNILALTRSYDLAAAPDVGWYNARIGSGLSSSAAVAYDDYLLVQVPEPASVMLSAIGVLGVLCVRRRTAS